MVSSVLGAGREDPESGEGFKDFFGFCGSVSVFSFLLGEETGGRGVSLSSTALILCI